MIINQAVEELADFIQLREDLHFDMHSSKRPEPHKCGTAGCIGGFAAALWKEECLDFNLHFLHSSVQDKLKLDVDSMRALCYPGDNVVRFWDSDAEVQYGDITRKGAIATLRRLARTGEVMWFAREQ